MKKLFLLLFVCSSVWAGPYIELGVDYDPEPGLIRTEEFPERFSGGSLEKKYSSHYIGVAEIGWEWDFKAVFADTDNMTIKLKAYEHRSDPLNEGADDIVASDEIRGLSVKYRFW